jgi:hypothetical protein
LFESFYKGEGGGSEELGMGKGIAGARAEKLSF